MGNFNSITLLGNLTKDPELSYLPSKIPVVEIDLAINHRWGKGQEKKESVCYISCRAFGKAAETLNKYMRRGMPLLISGRLDQDRWEDKDGQKRSKHRVFIEKFTFVGGGEKKAEVKEPKPLPQPGTTEIVPLDDSIPF